MVYILQSALMVLRLVTFVAAQEQMMYNYVQLYFQHSKTTSREFDLCVDNGIRRQSVESMDIQNTPTNSACRCYIDVGQGAKSLFIECQKKEGNWGIEQNFNIPNNHWRHFTFSISTSPYMYLEVRQDRNPTVATLDDPSDRCSLYRINTNGGNAELINCQSVNQSDVRPINDGVTMSAELEHPTTLNTETSKNTALIIGLAVGIPVTVVIIIVILIVILRIVAKKKKSKQKKVRSPIYRETTTTDPDHQPKKPSVKNKMYIRNSEPTEYADINPESLVPRSGDNNTDHHGMTLVYADLAISNSSPEAKPLTGVSNNGKEEDYHGSKTDQELSELYSKPVKKPKNT